MPPPRPPNRSESTPFPVFGSSWYAHAGTGTNVLAFGGGGGSARTGVNNAVIVHWNDEPPIHISTKLDVAVCMRIYNANEANNDTEIYVLVGLEDRVERYRLPEGKLAGAIAIGERVEALAVTVDRFAVGCESGMVKEFKINTDDWESSNLTHTYQGHEATICALAFSVRNKFLLSSAKDGTARVWKNGENTDILKNDITTPKDPPLPKNRRKPQVMVRGCCFADIDGNVVLTVASAKRGNAFLTKWVRAKDGKLASDQRTLVHPMPVSSMSNSDDGQLIALGTVDGSIQVLDMQTLKKLKIFEQVHGLPVTTLAARPLGVPLQAEEDDVWVHARSFSADGQSWCLTLQKPPRNFHLGGFGKFLVQLLYGMVLVWLTTPLWTELSAHAPVCGMHPVCLWEHAILAPSTRPGINQFPQ